MKSEINVGIVFSGGFAKGAYEIGFCKAILEYINKENIKIVSGASIGAINAYGFINNKLDYLCDIWKNIEFKSSKEFFLKQEKRNIAYDYINNLVDSESNAEEKTENNICYINYIKVPNILLCYENINKEEKEIKKELLKACISVPTLYKPVWVKNSFYVDGAFLDNTPVIPLKNKNLDLIFVLRFDHSSDSYENLNMDSTVIEIVFEDDKKLKEYFYFNKHLTKKLIKEGYNQSKSILNKVFECGYDLSHIKQVAKSINKKSKTNLIPKTGEEVVRKINKLSRMFKTECLENIEPNTNNIVIVD